MTARFKREATDGREHLTWYWVVDERGACSTWFSDTRAIIGHSVCSGRGYHSPRPWRHAEEHGPCEFIESECWTDLGSGIGLEPLQDAFDQGNEEGIYAWLEYGLEELACD